MKSILNILNRWSPLAIMLLLIFGTIFFFTNRTSDNSAQEIQNAVSPTATPLPTKAPPKVSFSGSVEPSVVRAGEKVVITFEIQNEDATQAIDGMRILFANEDFIEKGLSVVNVMSGGIKQGRAFQWTNDLMKIPPKEKQTFTIVAVANDKGKYESVVTFVNPTNSNDFDDQDTELSAKLLVY